MMNRGYLKKSSRRMRTTPKRGYVCKHCGSPDHYSFACFSQKKKPIPVESKKHKESRMKTRRAWFRAPENKPDEQGRWPCYLRIADDCPKFVTSGTIDLEHVRPKGSHPKLRHQILNIKAACQPCNKLKRSWSIEVLAETYPHIAEMIATPEWIAFDKQLTELEESL